MKRSLYIFIATLILSFLSVRESKADVSVNIHDTVNSSSSTTSITNNHTSIHIEDNGQVQDYNSDNAGDVHMQSSDGHAKVDITNNVNSNSTITPSVTLTPTPTITPPAAVTPTISENNEINHQGKVIQEHKKNIPTEIQNIFLKIFSFFRSIFFHR